MVPSIQVLLLDIEWRSSSHMRIVYIALGWCLGIALGAATRNLLPPIFWLAGLGTLSILLLTPEFTSFRRILWLCLAICLGACRVLLMPQAGSIAAFNDYASNVVVRGVVTNLPDVREMDQRLRLQTEYLTSGGQIYAVEGLVLVKSSPLAVVNYGDRIEVVGRLTTPQTFDMFSYSDFLARNGIYSLVHDAHIRVLDEGNGNPVIERVYELRELARQRIGAALPDPAAALLTGILLGDESGIDPELRDAFSATGAAHIIAISGFNMVIFSGIVMCALRSIIHRRSLVALLGVIAIMTYTVFVGGGAAVLRAAVMSCLLVIAPLLGRRTYLPASLAFAVIILTVENPFALWDVGFQLSVVAVLGLTLFTEPFGRLYDRMSGRNPDNWLHTLVQWMREPIVVTLAVQLTVLPLSALYFQQVSLIALLVNVLIVPIQAGILLLGGAATLIALLLPALAQILFWLCGLLLGWTIGVVRLLADWPGAALPVSVDPRLVFAFFFLVIGGGIVVAERPVWWLRFASYLSRRTVRVTVMVTGAGIGLLLMSFFLSRPDGHLHVWFLNVGHSHAVMVQTPGGAQILINGGPYPNRLLTILGERMPFHDRHIEVVVATQTDATNIGALPAVFERYSYGVLLTNGHENMDMLAGDRLNLLLRARPAADGQGAVIPVSAGYSVAFDDGMLIEIMYPMQSTESANAGKQNVLIVRLSYRDISFLLMSDSDTAAQEFLMAEGLWPLATVLQLPRHGRFESLHSGFLDAVQPSIIVLQSEAGNRFNDPDVSTLYRTRNWPLYRTDLQGELHFVSDGMRLWHMEN